MITLQHYLDSSDSSEPMRSLVKVLNLDVESDLTQLFASTLLVDHRALSEQLFKFYLQHKAMEVKDD